MSNGAAFCDAHLQQQQLVFVMQTKATLAAAILCNSVATL
jgi:hypothetical protein